MNYKLLFLIGLAIAIIYYLYNEIKKIKKELNKYKQQSNNINNININKIKEEITKSCFEKINQMQKINVLNNQPVTKITNHFHLLV